MNLISAIEFHNGWLKKNEDTFLYYGELNFEKLNLNRNDCDFFIVGGIPRWAAPNLYFFVPDKINLISKRFFCFGEDALDRKICIDIISGGKVVLIDKGGAYKCFLNSSIQSMCTTLFYYMNMIDDAIKIKGKNAFLENDIPMDLIVEFENCMNQYDNEAIKKGGFWDCEIKRLKKTDE